ncbi:MAG: S9 family peptidase, partial [Acidimicrobiales bacterium]
NRYGDSVLEPTKQLQREIYEEIRKRVVQTDVSAEVPNGDYIYFTRTSEGSAYTIHCRRQSDGIDSEEVILDENELAAHEKYLVVGALALTPSQQILAYTTDNEGSERYELHFKDLSTGKLLDDVVELVSDDIAWADDQTIFYTSPDELLRPWQVWRHRLGTDPGFDQIVFEEPDERFYVSCRRSRDRNWIVISTDSVVTSEVRLVECAHPERSPAVVAAKEQGHEYLVEPCGQQLFVLSNDEAPHFRLLKCDIDHFERGAWVEVLNDPTMRLNDLDAFASQLVVSAQKGGLPLLLVHALSSGDWRELELHEQAYELSMANNLEFETDNFQFSYESMVTPPSVFAELFDGSARTIVKQQEVLGGYDPALYETLRLWAPSTDGAHVPVSVVRHRDFASNGPAATVIYGYGSYEMSVPVGFSIARLSLLDRGIVWVICHARGGGELGRDWYENGKLGNKQHTFDDVFATAEMLVESGISEPERIAVWGRSAGGLLSGASVTQRPELFCAAIVDVPFVDVVNTMLDEQLPLTTTEWDEWGNPNEPAAYETMMTYAPYENVVDQQYPALLVTAGLHDPRVGFWEPAKWVAKMRLHQQGDTPILLRTELGSGHFGNSGRYEEWHKQALSLAFLVWRLTSE